MKVSNLLWAAILLIPIAGAASAQAPTVRRGYVDMRFGQLHYTVATPTIPGALQNTPIVLLHQSPNTSLEYGPLVPELGKDRITIAVDTPGYGGSDGPKDNATIHDYAGAIGEGLRALGFGEKRPVDVMGYHTGAFTAAELAITDPTLVRRLVLSGIYIVPEKTRLEKIATFPRYKTSRDFFAWFCGALPEIEDRQLGRSIPDPDWGRVTADSLRPVTRREYGHDAALAYAKEAKIRMGEITQPVLLLAIGDTIHDETVASKPFFKNASLVDLPQYHEGVFFTDPAGLGSFIRKFLD